MAQVNSLFFISPVDFYILFNTLNFKTILAKENSFIHSTNINWVYITWQYMQKARETQIWNQINYNAQRRVIVQKYDESTVGTQNKAMNFTLEDSNREVIVEKLPGEKSSIKIKKILEIE